MLIHLHTVYGPFYAPKGQSYVAVAEIRWSAKPKIFALRPFVDSLLIPAIGEGKKARPFCKGPLCFTEDLRFYSLELRNH